MQFQIEDLVKMPNGLNGIVTSFKSQEEIVVVPLDKGTPQIFKSTELELIYSFLSELDALTDDASLIKILSMNEETLKEMQSKVKEKKKKGKSEGGEVGQVAVDI